MSVYLFTMLFYLLLLFSVMCGTLLCGHVYATNGTGLSVDGGKAVNLFKENEKRSACVEVNDYYFPVLVSANNVFVALAGVNCKGDNEKILKF